MSTDWTHPRPQCHRGPLHHRYQFSRAPPLTAPVWYPEHLVLPARHKFLQKLSIMPFFSHLPAAVTRQKMLTLSPLSSHARPGNSSNACMKRMARRKCWQVLTSSPLIVSRFGSLTFRLMFLLVIHPCSWLYSRRSLMTDRLGITAGNHETTAKIANSRALIVPFFFRHNRLISCRICLTKV